MSGEYDIGMIGLGTMGANLALNMADHGFRVVGYDRDQDRAKKFQERTARPVAPPAPSGGPSVQPAPLPAGQPVPPGDPGLQPLPEQAGKPVPRVSAVAQPAPLGSIAQPTAPGDASVSPAPVRTGEEAGVPTLPAPAPAPPPTAGAASIAQFVAMLKIPRAVMLLVPAGKPVDDVIAQLVEHLSPGDIIIDGGNSHFRDTDRRGAELAQRGLHFLGVGISGGEEGARLGPSIMPGGPPEAYERVRPIFEAVAARVNGEPCVTYLGPGSAGHYVKMVHNGIEYGLMQLIAETYDLMKRGLRYTADQLADTYAQWNQRELESFLIEITAHIFRQIDETTGLRLIDFILDEAHQKGTGMWTSQTAFELHVPAPTIDVAVSMRDLSDYREQRARQAKLLTGPDPVFRGHRDVLVRRLENALWVGMVVTYAQGLDVLAQASKTFGYNLALDEVARIWRGGCIIRAALLEAVRAAYRARRDLSDLLMDEGFAQKVAARQGDLRAVVATTAELGIPAPALMACLSYIDSYRSDWLPDNLIQAQRDYFGAHTYQRTDVAGSFHTQWNRKVAKESP
jgi:6-phosphogluconate dehydrogenase